MLTSPTSSFIPGFLVVWLYSHLFSQCRFFLDARLNCQLFFKKKTYCRPISLEYAQQQDGMLTDRIHNHVVTPTSNQNCSTQLLWSSTLFFVLFFVLSFFFKFKNRVINWYLVYPAPMHRMPFSVLRSKVAATVLFSCAAFWG